MGSIERVTPFIHEVKGLEQSNAILGDGIQDGQRQVAIGFAHPIGADGALVLALEGYVENHTMHSS